MVPPLPIVLPPNERPTELHTRKTKIMLHQSRSFPTNLQCSTGLAISRQKPCLTATNMTGTFSISVALLFSAN